GAGARAVAPGHHPGAAASGNSRAAANQQDPPALRATAPCRRPLGRAPGCLRGGRATPVLPRAAVLPLGRRLALRRAAARPLGAGGRGQCADGIARPALTEVPSAMAGGGSGAGSVKVFVW